MAIKEKATKKRTPKLGVPSCAECVDFLDTFANVLRASGSATTPRSTTLTALLTAARGIELVLMSRPEQERDGLYEIGLAHSLAATIKSKDLLIATEAIIKEWTYPPAVVTKPRRDSKKRVAPKRRARS